MMQQLASMRTESATPALPFTLSASALSVQLETRQTFNNEMLRQSRAADIYEEAPPPRETNNSSHKNKESQNTYVQASTNNRELASHRQANARKEQNERARAHLDEQHTKDNESKASNEIKPLLSASGNKIINVNQDNLRDQKVNSTELAPMDEGDAVTHSQDKSIKEQFDYLDYVTQLAEFTDSKVSKGNETLSAINEVHIGQEISAVKVDVEDKRVKIEIPVDFAVNTPLGNEGSNNANTIRFELSPQDLQSIIEMQQAKLANGASLSTQDKTELSRIIDDLASQIDPQNFDSPNESSVEFSETDKDLLAELLLTQPSQPNDNIRFDDDQNDPIELELVPLNLEPPIVNTVLGKENVKPNDIFVIKPENTPNSVSVIDAKQDNSDQIKGVSEDENSINTKLTHPDIEQERLVQGRDNKAFKDKQTIDVSAFSLRNITQLNEEQSKIALEGLTTKIQSVSSSIIGENKGNEFIAALQSSVKEFKQQLAQGGEPALDLKTMVAEAMANISGEISAKQQPKIDAALNQFNAVLNLATAVNQSANLQPMQDTAQTDNQLAKEFNLQHIEGTKLAKGIQNQSIAQASADKAINIFKQEGQQKLAEKVRWMVNSKNATAEIRLDPPDLGGVNIKVNLSGDTALVNFNVQSTAAKEALDQAVPKLREMLQEQGIELGQSSVQQDSQNGDRGEQPENAGNLAQAIKSSVDSAPANIDDKVSHIAEQRVSGGVLGGIDYYA